MLPAKRFYLMGMGSRRKVLYRDGGLWDLADGSPLGAWDVAEERILPAEYRVELRTRRDERVVIGEDQTGLWIEQGGSRDALDASPVQLPTFQGYPHAALLRTLHQDILVNITPAGPVPNFLVYPKPWYRDAAMMCMCLEKTGNLGFIRPWIESLTEPFDRNNAGHREPDNLGQLLYLASRASGRSHPLVETVLKTVPEFCQKRHIVGITDGAEHPVYQTKWLKYGLACLGLDDPYEIPAVVDSYSSLFWMDYRNQHVAGPRFRAPNSDYYPYLAWAEAHFYGDVPAGLPAADAYPITWEARASEASYEGMAVVSREYVDQRICAPHTWHAAEMFLYLLECGV